MTTPSPFHAAAAQLHAEAKRVAAGLPPTSVATDPGVTGTPPVPIVPAQAAPPANGPVSGAQGPVPYERVQELSHANGELRARLDAQAAELAALRAAMTAATVPAAPAAPAQPADPSAIAAEALRRVREMEVARAAQEALGSAHTADQRAAVESVMRSIPGLSATEALAVARARAPQAFQGLPSAPPSMQVPGPAATQPTQAELDRAILANPLAPPGERQAAQSRHYGALAVDFVTKARSLF